MTRRYARARWIGPEGLLATTMLVCAAPACAEAPVKSYDMPAQPLGSALTSISERSGAAIIAPSALVEGRRAPALRGSFGTDEAIRYLLQGSGLVVERVGDSYVVKRAARSEVDGLGDQDTDILVTGTRIRGAPIASTVVRLEAEVIRNSGQATVADALRSLPQNFGGGQNPGMGFNVPEGSGTDIGGGSGINLRGIGPDATLTLLNGHRLPYSAVAQSIDISAIPLDTVDRIEIVADGASALYGSDAVAGVANIVLKRDFDGLRTRARVGGSTDGGNFQQQYSLVGGKAWDSGGLLVAYEFARSTQITAADRDYTRSKPGITLYPYLKRHSVVVAGHQEIAPGITFSIDGLYGRRWKEATYPLNPAGDLSVSRFTNDAESLTWVIAPSIAAKVGAWRIELGGAYGKDRINVKPGQYVGTTFTDTGSACLCNTGRSVELGGDGPVFALPGGDAQLAIGLGWRDNRLNRTSPINPVRAFVGSQDSQYAYGEVNLPLVSPALDIGGINRLSLSAALRYERYPGLDEVATPKLGLIYSPTPGFTLKGSWGKSFRAPTLIQLYQNVSTSIDSPSYYGGTGFPAGSQVLFFNGGNPALKPERANSWSATAVLEPPPLPGLRLEVGLFHTRYKDRIVAPIILFSRVLVDPTVADRVTVSPTPAQVAAVIAQTDSLTNYTSRPLDPAKVVAVIDDLFVNAAQQTIKGVDFLVDYRTGLGGGTLALSANASLLDSEQLRGVGQSITQLAGTIFNSPHFRGRATANWTKGPFSLAATVNRIGGVDDARYTPASTIRGMTTFDFALRLQPTRGIAKGFDLLLSAENAFNAKPAVIRALSFLEAPYDSTNYSPLGRVVSFSVAKTW